MTTLGYGDKIPRSGLARLFSIVWILIGITTFSLITAMLSSELNEMNSAGHLEMTGHRIGVQRYRTFDSIVIAKNGGIAKPTAAGGAVGVSQVVEMLRRNEIDGFVLDRFTMITFHTFFQNHPDFKSVESYFHSAVDRSELSYNGEKLSYGILLKRVEDYNYLAEFVLDNQQVINTCNGLMLNSYSAAISLRGGAVNPLFSTTGGLFWPSVIIGSAAIGCIVSFGILYEWSRGKICMRAPLKSHITKL